MVNLELYKVFYTVAKCGSLTKAAEELYISQPAVSQAIKQLEGQLGAPLFRRLHRGMELSAQAGELIYPDVERALSLLGGVEDRLAQMKNTATGSLRIGASETIFRYCLAEKIVEYHKQYPEIRLELMTDVSPRTIARLKHDECDIGFLNLPIEEDEAIALTENVMLLNDVFVAGKEFSFLKGRQIAMWELQQYPILLLAQGTVARTTFDRYCAQLGVKLVPTVEVDDWSFMKQLVADGMGIGCVPREYIRNKLEAGLLFELSVTPTLPTRSVGMALPRNANMSFALRAFIDLLRKKP